MRSMAYFAATSFTMCVGLTAGEINPLAMTYGYEKLRFPRPVFIGDTIRTRVCVAEKRGHKRPDYGIVVEKLEVINQRDECVMACEHLLLV
jgi:acyl dehydratase